MVVAGDCLQAPMAEAKKLALAQRLFFLYFTEHDIITSNGNFLGVNLEINKSGQPMAMLFLGYYLQHPKLGHQPMRLSDKDDRPNYAI